MSNNPERHPAIATEENGILWLKPGAGLNMSKQSFNRLFVGYQSVCRAAAPCEVRVKIYEGGREKWLTYEFKKGDAIAATSVEREDELLKLLNDRNHGADFTTKVKFGEGPEEQKSGEIAR